MKMNDKKNILIYSDKLASFEYGPDHPFKPYRAKHFMSLLDRYTLIYEKDQKVIEPILPDEIILYSFHNKGYIQLLKKANEGTFIPEMLEAGIGNFDNPVIKGMFDFALLATGGTYTGAQLLLDTSARFVFNPVGGFHHAYKDYAEGFCYINDIAISINKLINEGLKVAYIDIDVHHGNGVQDAFYDNNRVLTISLHETGKTLYPWGGSEDEIGIREGVGYNINIPYLAESDDDIYLHGFRSLVPHALEWFVPDIIFMEIGGDSHKDDPLAHLNLTSNGYQAVISEINALSPKILATGGGGYNVYKTAALWALAWATICDIAPQDDYAGMVGGVMYGTDDSAGSLDDPPFLLDGDKKRECMEHIEQVISKIKANVFREHGI